jgi:pantoate--beta-alanine ligase
LKFPVRIVGHPTIREADGLAVSSRNAYLLPAERAVAPYIHDALQRASQGATCSAVLKEGRRLIGKIPGARLDYLELVDAETLGTQLADQILAGGGRQVLDTVRPSVE